MKIVKGLALGLLSFLLFLSLSFFGLIFTLNSTALNPDFFVSEMDKLDISLLVEEFLSEETAQEDLPEEFRVALVSTVAELEPVVKERVGAAIYPVFDYLRGENQELDLAVVLSDTILSPDFVASLIDKIDISALAEEMFAEEIAAEIPQEMGGLVEYVDDALAELEPWLKEQANIVAEPILEYLLGKSQSLSVVISMEPVAEILENTMREPFLESPPEELASLTRPQLEQYFDDNVGEVLAEVVPSTFEIDEDTLGTEIPLQISEALAEAEEGLAEARQYVGYFQLGYKLLIGFILLLVLGIVLIYREVRGATRDLGITFVTCGVITFIGNLVAKHFAGASITHLDIPTPLQTWLPQLLSDFLTPLDIYSIVLAVIGIAMLVVSFVYKPRLPES
jgi:hypothetical protein